MKFGPRMPSVKKTIKARTTGKVKRKIKKSVNPLYGKKGMGWATDPKRAAYNKVYNKTSFDVTGRDKSNNLGCFSAFFMLLGLAKHSKQTSPYPGKSPARTTHNDHVKIPLTLTLAADESGDPITYRLPSSDMAEPDRLQVNETFIVGWLNKAPLTMLTEINGVGPQTAERIIAHRPYAVLSDVSGASNGVGEHTLVTLMHLLDTSGKASYVEAYKKAQIS